MSNPSPDLEKLQIALCRPARGVFGIVDELLAVACGQALHLDWQGGHCHVKFLGDQAVDVVDAPVGKSVVRAILARIAVLCNERKPDSVSPYGGDGELSASNDSATTIRASFVNTPGEQHLDLTPVSSNVADRPTGRAAASIADLPIPAHPPTQPVPESRPL